ncbi:MAG: hypothetical protein P1V97_31530, partial [Planctomycetota bacterium]|nr:hypothetical protein [Planctomycetota bacterium]
MSDRELAALERQLSTNPEQVELRSSLYRLLLRMGRVSPEMILKAARLGDAAALILEPDPDSETYLSNSDLKALRDLPCRELFIEDHKSDVTARGLTYLKDMSLHSLLIEGHSGIT